jgi:hypothetical protein
MMQEEVDRQKRQFKGKLKEKEPINAIKQAEDSTQLIAKAIDLLTQCRRNLARKKFEYEAARLKKQETSTLKAQAKESLDDC